MGAESVESAEVSKSKETNEKKPYKPIWWESRFLRHIANAYVIAAAVREFNVEAKAMNTESPRTINEDMVYKRRHDHTEFHALVEGAREVYLDKLEAKVFSSAVSSESPEQAMKILERLRSEKWAAPEKRVKLLGDPNQPIHHATNLNVNWAESDVQPESLPEPPPDTAD